MAVDSEGNEEELILDLPGTLRSSSRGSLPSSRGGCCFEGIDGTAWAQAVKSKTAAEVQPKHNG